VRFAQVRRADFEGVALLRRQFGVEDLQNALASNYARPGQKSET
jgi:hypothetical protein